MKRSRWLITFYVLMTAFYWFVTATIIYDRDWDGIGIIDLVITFIWTFFMVLAIRHSWRDRRVRLKT
jgi:hypothetical protein